MSEQRDPWWNVTADTDPNELATQMWNAVTAYGFPWLARMGELPGLYLELQNKKSFWEAAGAAVLLGDRAAASQFVKLWIEKWRAQIEEYSDLEELVKRFPQQDPAHVSRIAAVERNRCEQFVQSAEAWAHKNGL